MGWTLDRSNVPNAVYFAMKSHRIKAQTLGGEGVWRSAVVNISGYTGIQVDAKISSEGSFSSSEYVKVSYILNGGPETLIGEYTGAFGTPLVTSAQMTGSTVQIVIRMYNVSAGNNDYYIEQYDVFKETGPCTVSSGISVSASASNSGVLTCSNPSTTLSASTTASGTTTYSWTGPSGFTATGASVTATTAGTYNVTGTNSAGTGTASVTVTSNTAAPAGLTATASGSLSCATTSVTLTGSSTTSGTTFSWSGPSGFTATGATATATAAGTYTLTATNPTTGCTSTTTVAVTSNTAAPAGLTATASGVLTCAVSGITLTGSSTTSGVTYAWTGPNSYSNTGASVTANMAGTYTVTATNPATGCTASTTVAVTSNTTNPTNITPTVSGPLTCSATSVTLSGSSSLSNAVYTWAGPGGFTASGATATASTAGTYTLTATNPTTGCWGSTAINVTSNTTTPAGVTATASGSGLLTCATTSVTLTGASTTTGATFAWSGPSGFTATGATATATAAGTYTVTATNPATGCTATASKTVTQNLTAPAGVTAGNNGPLTCSTTSATLSGTSTTTSGVTYAWAGTGNVSSFTASGASATVTNPGTYILTATYTSTGCTATAMTTAILVTTTPGTVTASNNGPLSCAASSVTLSGSVNLNNGTTYAWTGPSGFTASGASATATAPGTYTLTATYTSTGCTSTGTTTVVQNIAAPASVAATASGSLSCTASSVTLTGSSTTSGATFAWSGPGGFTATGATATATAAGAYTLTATNPASGCVATASVTVTGNTIAPAGVAITPNLPTLTCANPSVTLTGTSSTSGVSYAWTGPGSFTATGTQAATVTPGEYVLTVTNPANGCTTSTAATVNGNFAPPANVTAINNGPQTCYNVAVALTGSSTTTGATFAWTGPNGFTANSATAHLTSLGQDGTYSLTVTDPNNGCTAIAATVVAENDAAPTGVSVSSSTGSPVLNCTNPSLTLTASSTTPGVTYAWRIGPTGSTVLGTSDTLTVSQANAYDVLVTNPANGCAFLGGLAVSQNVTPPSNLLLTSNPATPVLTCTTTSIACNANASGSKVGYTWTGPGGFSFHGQTTDLSVPGTYSVTATDSTDGCSSTASTTITQDITPPSAVTIGSATGTTIINCTNPTLSLTAGSSPNTASYSWSGPNSYTANTATASVTVPGTYIVTATLASNGCSKTANVLIALDTASPAGITTSSVPANATLTCTNPNVLLTGSSATPGVTYNWTGPNSFSAHGSSVTVATAGNYVVTVTNPVNGCSSAVTASAVTQNLAIPIGVSTITSNKLSCNVTSVSVTANSSTSGATYTWTGPQGFTADTRVISAILGGAYTVTVTNPANGCTTSKTATVVADTATPAGVTATNSGPLTCTMTTVTLTGNSTTAGVSYTWNGPNGFFDPEQVSTSATDSGAYILTVSNSGNGCITNDTTYVSADFSECSAVTPKVAAAKASTLNDSTAAGAFTYKVFPNPTGNTAVSITFNSPTAANVVVAIYNNAGVQERILFSNAVEANQPYRLTLNPGGLGSGIHYCQIRVNDKVYTTKLLVLPN